MSATAVWQVPSHTRPDVVHRVTLQPDGSLSCSCEAAFHGRWTCRHRTLVLIAEEVQPWPMTRPTTREDEPRGKL
jgi:hypothetical protein